MLLLYPLVCQTEMGSKNHEVVPASLIASISGIRSGIGNKLMGQMAKRNLIARVQNIKCACGTAWAYASRSSHGMSAPFELFWEG